MVSGECNVSSDCLDGTGVVRFCYEEAAFSDETFFCDCNNWYGWVGENCDEVSTQLTYFRIALIITASWGLLVVCFTSRTLYYHIRAKINKGTGFNTSFYTGLLISAGCFLFAMNALIQLPSMFDHTRFEIERYRNLTHSFEDVTVKGGRAALYFYVFGSVSLFVAAIQIVSSWSNIIASTSKFFPDLFCVKEKTLRLTAKIFIALLGIFLLLFLSLDLIFAWSLMIAVASFLVTFAYLVGYRRFVSALKILENGKSSASTRAIRTITLSVRVNTVCLVLVILFTVLFYFVYQDYRRHLVLGDFNYVLLLRDLATYTTLLLYSFNSWYCHNVSKKILKLHEDNSCVPKVTWRSNSIRTAEILERRRTTDDNTITAGQTHLNVTKLEDSL